MRSPSPRRMGASPTACPQHVPRAIKWYSMTRWAPGITLSAISRDSGASATHGELSSRSKYTAPLRRTARSTSESTSAVMRPLRGSDARASGSDVGAGPPYLRTSG